MTTALLVIDVQNGFNDPAWGTRNNPDAEANIAALTAAWRDSDDPIVLVRHDSNKADSPLRPGQSGNDLQPLLADVQPALLFGKTVNSAFLGDVDLDHWLGERGITRVVVCGIQTNMCVETTARMGGNLGYDIVVPIDATYTFELKGPDGTVLSADQLAAATAVNLQGGGFAEVTSTARLLAGRA
jgi:nicotinamidase-related amidase